MNSDTPDKSNILNIQHTPKYFNFSLGVIIYVEAIICRSIIQGCTSIHSCVSVAEFGRNVIETPLICAIH